MPWSDPRHLTISFAPDGTDVGGTTSNLFAALGAVNPNWQREVLRAFQSWAALANIDVALVPDNGQPFGTGGSRQGDPRFGDIRVGGAVSTGETLGAAVPPDATFAGTWAGDVLLNTSLSFSGPSARDLYSIALHEAGHALGLVHSPSAASVMNETLSRRFIGLFGSDVTALTNIYGVRVSDRWEGPTGDNSLRSAARLDTSGGFDGTTPLVTFGDVGRGDVDYYALPPLGGYTGGVTVRLRSAGISLLAPKVTVLDSFGRTLGTASSTNLGGDTVEVHLGAVTPGATYYLRVEGATRDVFGIGGYSLAVLYDGKLTTPADRIDAVMTGPYEALSASELIALFKDAQHQINDDHGTDDGLIEAQRLAAAPGFNANTHYQVLGSLGLATDVDSYRVRGPSNFGAGKTGVLTVTVWSLQAGGTAPTIKIFDRDQNPVPTQVLANFDGTFMVQATGIRSGRDFYVQVSSADGLPAGNYGLSADFGTRVAQVDTFAAGDLTPAAPARDYNLYVAKMQVFGLLLTAQGGPLRMTITDQNGVTIETLTAADGQTVSVPGLMLKPGPYRVHFQALGDGTTLPPLTSFTLKGSVWTDPVGPIAGDPTTQPQYTQPGSSTTFIYPPGTVTTSPFLWSLLVL
jgi:hypothetical protein